MDNNTTLADEIIKIVQSNSTNTPPPQKAEIVRNYTSDNKKADIKFADGSVLFYNEIIGSNTVGNTGLFVYTDEQSGVFITSGGGSGGDITGVDVDFTYDFGIRGVQDRIDVNIFLKTIEE